jgi:hypothetical protein
LKPTVEANGIAGIDATIDRAGHPRIGNGETRVRVAGIPAVRIDRPRRRPGRHARKANRAETHLPPHVQRDLPTDPAEKEMNRFRIKSNRQRFRSTFCQRNAPSRR